MRYDVDIPPPHQPSPAPSTVLRLAQDKAQGPQARFRGPARLLRLPLKGGVIGPFI